METGFRPIGYQILESRSPREDRHETHPLPRIAAFCARARGLRPAGSRRSAPAGERAGFAPYDGGTATGRARGARDGYACNGQPQLGYPGVERLRAGNDHGRRRLRVTVASSVCLKG